MFTRNTDLFPNSTFSRNAAITHSPSLPRNISKPSIRKKRKPVQPWQGSIAPPELEQMHRFVTSCMVLHHMIICGIAYFEHETDLLGRPLLLNIDQQEANEFGFYAVNEITPGRQHVLVLFERQYKISRPQPPDCFSISNECLCSSILSLTDANVVCAAVLCVSPKGFHLFRLIPSPSSNAKMEPDGFTEFAKEIVDSMEKLLSDKFREAKEQNVAFFRTFFKSYGIQFDYFPSSKKYLKQGIRTWTKKLATGSSASASLSFSPTCSFIPADDTSSCSSFASMEQQQEYEDDAFSTCSSCSSFSTHSSQQQCLPAPPLPPPFQMLKQSQQQSQIPTFSRQASTLPPQAATLSRQASTLPLQPAPYSFVDKKQNLPSHKLPLPPPVQQQQNDTQTLAPIVLPVLSELELYGPRPLPDGQVLFVVDQVIRSLCPTPYFTTAQQAQLLDVYMTLAEIFNIQQPTRNAAIEQYRNYVAILDEECCELKKEDE